MTCRKHTFRFDQFVSRERHTVLCCCPLYASGFFYLYGNNDYNNNLGFLWNGVARAEYNNDTNNF